MSEMLKLGNRIIIKPAGSEYDLIPGKIYDLKSDMYHENQWLEENGNFNLPPKIYHSTEDAEFIKRIITYFNACKKQTTGVLLNGVKGTGKTVMAKKLAIDSGLPVIIPHESFPTKKLLDFFKAIKTPVCILFDEVEKCRDTEKLLTFLDGVEATCKKLVILTSNDNKEINTNLFDRPSRIRYYREFVNNIGEYIKEILIDQDINDIDDKIYNFINAKFKTVSIDNIMSLIEEIKISGYTNLDDVIKYLNIVPSSNVETTVLKTSEKLEQDEIEYDNQLLDIKTMANDDDF